MKRWNGWGEENFEYPVVNRARDFLAQSIGEPVAPKDITLETLVNNVPESRLSEHPLISIDKIERIKHSVGQSLPDWIAIKSGYKLTFPDGVAYPHNENEVKEIVDFAVRINAIIIPYGGGTSVVGHLTVPDQERPVISVDMGRMNKLLDIDKEGGLATFQAGVRGPELEASLRSHGYTLGHFPQSFEFSTLGGWVAARSAGQFSLNYGKIDKLFAGGSVVTAQGNIKLPPFPASAAGPDLRELIMGSEGRYGIITECTVRISPIPEAERFNAAFFKTEEDGIKAVKQAAQAGLPLAMLRLSLAKETTTNLAQTNPTVEQNMLEKYLSLRGANDNKAMLIYGAVGTKQKVNFALSQTLDIIKENNGIYVGSAIGKHWYKNRFTVPYLRNTLWEMGYAVDTLETANIWERVPETVNKIERAIEQALTDSGEKVHVFTHLSHIYSHGSSIYTSYLFRLADNPKETFKRWQKCKTAASKAIIEAGGTISHQHGVGLDHKPYLEAEKGQLGLKIIKSVGSTLDPDQMFNPKKLFD